MILVSLPLRGLCKSEAGKAAERVKALAAKWEDLSLLPKTLRLPGICPVPPCSRGDLPQGPELMQGQRAVCSLPFQKALPIIKT